jgi:hypothetical protein
MLLAAGFMHLHRKHYHDPVTGRGIGRFFTLDCEVVQEHAAGGEGKKEEEGSTLVSLFTSCFTPEDEGRLINEPDWRNSSPRGPSPSAPSTSSSSRSTPGPPHQPDIHNKGGGFTIKGRGPSSVFLKYYSHRDIATVGPRHAPGGR